MIKPHIFYSRGWWFACDRPYLGHIVNIGYGRTIQDAWVDHVRVRSGRVFV